MKIIFFKKRCEDSNSLQTGNAVINFMSNLLNNKQYGKY